jgi:hypothetical protein
MWRPRWNFWFATLVCVTAVLVPLTALAFVVMWLGDTIGDGGHYRWLSLIPLAVVVVLWVFVVKTKPADHQKGPPTNSKGISGG